MKFSEILIEIYLRGKLELARQQAGKSVPRESGEMTYISLVKVNRVIGKPTFTITYRTPDRELFHHITLVGAEHLSTKRKEEFIIERILEKSLKNIAFRDAFAEEKINRIIITNNVRDFVIDRQEETYFISPFLVRDILGENK